MTETLGVDYSWARPDPGELKRLGYDFVVRYLSSDPSKNLSPSERDALHKAGLSILLVWEDEAEAALKGRARGIADRREAGRMAAALHYPKGSVLFMAVDFGATAAQVAAYVGGAARVRDGYRLGLYGDGAVLAAHPKLYRWQAGAATSWPGNAKLLEGVDIYQRAHPTRKGAPSGIDENAMLHPVPMWEPVTVEPGQNPSPLGLDHKEAAAAVRQVNRLLSVAVKWRHYHPHWSRGVHLTPVIKRLVALRNGMKKKAK